MSELEMNVFIMFKNQLLLQLLYNNSEIMDDLLAELLKTVVIE